MKIPRLILCLCLTVAAAQAATIYVQPPSWSGNGSTVASSWASQVASGTGARAFDNFTLGSAASITQATWYGIYLADPGPNYTNGAPNTTTWSIDFFSSVAGAPGTSLSNTTLAAGAVTQTLVGTGLFGANTVNIYSFTANLNAFNAAAGTTYWFSPLSSGPTFSPHFSWIQGTGGDSTSIQQSITGGSVTASFTRNTDRAFSLSGNVANAPDSGSTAAIFGAALAALALLRRRLVESVVA